MGSSSYSVSWPPHLKFMMALVPNGDRAGPALRDSRLVHQFSNISNGPVEEGGWLRWPVAGFEMGDEKGWPEIG